MVPIAACTIVSKNYLAYAKTLCQSFKKFNPDSPFYVLLVDEMGDLNLEGEHFEIFEAKKIGVTDFRRISFRFGILELNTNLKPSFLKFLMKEKLIERLLYIDPDIQIVNEIQPVFDSLDDANIILTPHCTSPIEDGMKPNEQDFLSSGVFNLGFIGIKNTSETLKFLDWWENRCLTLGFHELRTGLFVDQKWCNLVPCLFEGVKIVKNAGWNMAYWNLHERRLSKSNDIWLVNDNIPLIFFHFSGIAVDQPSEISRHQNRYDLSSRSDLKELFDQYRKTLIENNMDFYKKFKYYYGAFSNGILINQLARTYYVINEDRFAFADPFDSTSDFYKACQQKNILSNSDGSAKYNTMTYNSSDSRIKFINSSLRIVLKILGGDRYSMLMKYLSYISILRNQKFL